MNVKKVAFTRRLLGWYDRHRRELPWRAPRGQRPDPYHVLVSEAMLQQTQVATVIPYFNRFIQALPRLHNLASADEQTVLRLWQGLGYYSRARNLLRAARCIMADHAGQIPCNVETLSQLPGIGRYTAGAIASIAFDRRAALVDGNVARVLCRLDRIESDPKDPGTRNRLWDRAEQLVPARRCGDFNSALMELGATVCSPRAPGCTLCPVRRFCQACRAGIQDTIPPPRHARAVRREERDVFCLVHGSSRESHWLIEQRPARGRWAGMWQFVTVATKSRPPTASDVRDVTGITCRAVRKIGTVHHTLTHRRYAFNIYVGCVSSKSHIQCDPRRWVRLDELVHYPLSRPQLRIVELLEGSDFTCFAAASTVSYITPGPA